MTEERKQPDILLVDWVDSCGTYGWRDAEECRAELSHCQTIGFLVEETKDAIALCLNRAKKDGHRPFGELITIPKCSIVSISAISAISGRNRKGVNKK